MIKNKIGTNTISENVFPICIIKNENDNYYPKSYLGTGFLIANKLMITCWHVVLAELQENESYGVAFVKDNNLKFLPFTDIEKDENGYDLATIIIDLKPTIPFVLSEIPLSWGTDIYTFGFPFSDFFTDYKMKKTINLNSRVLRGYITRNFNHIYNNVITPSYEISFSAPLGLSGAPLIELGSTLIYGVIYGNNDVALVTEFSSKDPQTGEIQPEINRIFSFGAAHFTNNLNTLKTKHTNHQNLYDYLYH